MDSGTFLDEVKNVTVCTGSGQRSSEGRDARRWNKPTGLLGQELWEGQRSYGASRKVLVRKMEETILPVALIVPSLSELDSESLLPE